jgi:hypothetical protein
MGVGDALLQADVLKTHVADAGAGLAALVRRLLALDLAALGATLGQLEGQLALRLLQPVVGQRPLRQRLTCRFHHRHHHCNHKTKFGQVRLK